jgi:BMFP domain-containing protein YqiC
MVWIVILIALCLLGMLLVLRAMLDELLSRVEALEDKVHAA